VAKVLCLSRRLVFLLLGNRGETWLKTSFLYMTPNQILFSQCLVFDMACRLKRENGSTVVVINTTHVTSLYFDFSCTQTFLSVTNL